MNDQASLAMLKANLEIRNTINDVYLTQLIEVAKSEITKEGIRLNVSDGTYSADQGNLIVMYAAYLYRRRTGTSEGHSTAALNPQGMPYMLRYALNNELFSQKMRAES